MKKTVSAQLPRDSGIWDRLAAAFGSAAVMAVTLVLLTTATVFALMVTSFVHLVDEHGAQQFVNAARFALFFDTFLVGAACTFVSLAALGGFVLGSERMARLFGVFWRTESPTRGEYWIVTATAVALLGSMAFYALRKLGIA